MTKTLGRSVSDFSLGWLTLGNPSPFLTVQAAAAAGFGSVSFRIAGRGRDLDPIFDTETQAVPRLQAALRDNNISLLHMGGIWLDGEQPVTAFEPAVALGARLGARMCVAIFTPNRERARMLAELAELARLAARYGMRVAVEFAAYLGIRTIDEALNIVEQCGETNAGLLIDALHLFRSGGAVTSVVALPSNRVFLAQFSDAPAARPSLTHLQTEARGNRLDIGMGELPLIKLLQALPSHVPLEIEAPCLAYRNVSEVERACTAADAVQTFLRSTHTSIP